jgi:hypothetical protein
MTIYINDCEVPYDWQPKPGTTSVRSIRLYDGASLSLPSGITSVGGIVLDDGAALSLPNSVTSVGNIRLYGGTALNLPSGCKVKGHAIADPEIAARRLKAVAKAATATPEALNMQTWHCGTAHCIAGWAVHLEGEAGHALEKEVGTNAAGVILLGVEAATLFFLDNDTARAALRRVLAGEPALPA